MYHNIVVTVPTKSFIVNYIMFEYINTGDIESTSLDGLLTPPPLFLRTNVVRATSVAVANNTPICIKAEKMGRFGVRR